jgi:hypothetical protein
MGAESEVEELLTALQEIFSLSSLTTSSSSLSHRFLASTPAWSDFLVVLILSLLLFGLLWYLVKRVTIQWKHMMETRVEIAKSKRRDRGDKFRDEHGYSWDVVFVFKVYEEKTRLTSQQCKWSLKRVMKELADGGLQTRLFYSCQADEVYCKVRVPPARLKKEADRIDMRCKLDPVRLKALCKTGRVVDGQVFPPPSLPIGCSHLSSQTLWGPLKLQDECPETPISPYEYIYVKFEDGRSDVADLYQTYTDRHLQFRGVDRLKLIFSILAAKKYEGGCSLDIYRLMKDDCLLGFYPLHDHVELTNLAVNWLQVFQWPWNQPNTQIKDYFGEKIGLYFLWLSHYTSWLLVAAIVGFFCWINVATNGNNPNAVIMPYFATFMAFWATLFLEFWKRKEATHAMKWGMTGYEEEEQSRPQFVGVKKLSPIDGKEYLYFNRNEEQQRAFQSSVVIWGFICIVIGTIAAIFTLKLVMNGIAALNPDGLQLGSIFASLLNALQISVLNGIYGDIAIRLTDYENHRTDTKYEDSLIAKTFLFQFVNSYASLFYIAFIKPFIPDLDPCLNRYHPPTLPPLSHLLLLPLSCMEELQTNLGTIFLTRLAVGNLQQVVVPTIMAHLKEKEQTKGATEEVSEVEKTFFMVRSSLCPPPSLSHLCPRPPLCLSPQPEYHVMLGPFDDFAEMMIQVESLPLLDLTNSLSLSPP